jgi:hypothetical protein
MLIDTAVEAGFQGRSVTRYEHGRLIDERRRNSPAQVMALVKRMRSKAVLGKPRVIAASRDFDHCLALLEQGIAYPDPDATQADETSSAMPSSGPSSGWSPGVQSLFCQMLAQCGSVEQACAAIGKPRSMAYATRHRAGGEAFAIAWDAALLFASEPLIDLAIELAITGSVEQIIKAGRIVRERRTVSARVMLNAAAQLGAVLAPVS